MLLWGALAWIGLSLVTTVAALAWHVSRYVGYHRALGLAPPPLTAEAARNEVNSLIEVGWLRLLRFRASHVALPVERTGRTVALVHGYWDQAASFWKLRDHLNQLGRPTIGIELGWQLGNLNRYADRLYDRLIAILADEPDGIDLVAHSMGGIVLRLVLHDHPELRERIRHAVTLGTPHRGTGAAERLPASLPEMREMHPGSPLLDDLPSLTELLDPQRVITIGGDFDMIVYPVQYALDDKAQTHIITGVGHAGLLTDDRVLELVAAGIAA